MNIFRRQGIGNFCVQRDAMSALRNLTGKLSTIHLYHWLCAHGEIEADAKKISKATGLDPDTIATARAELVRLGLISVRYKRGQGAKHVYTALNAYDFGQFEAKTFSYGRSGYYQVPRIFVSPRQPTFRDGNGAATLVYSTLLAEANRSGSPVLEMSKAKVAAAAGLTQKTTVKALKSLSSATIPLIRLGQGTVEILNPHTGRSLDAPLPEITAEPAHDESRPRIKFSEILSREYYERYYLGLLNLDPRMSQQNACCLFHDDAVPSMSVNLDKGMWHCHRCDIGGLMIDLEMRLLKTDDLRAAWKSIAAKLGFSLPRSCRGVVTHVHFYRAADGTVLYRVLRYENESAIFEIPLPNGKWLPGLNGVKRTIYNLPHVIEANLVLIVEGEKKADIVSALGLRDVAGLPVAVTCTGHANSWRDEFAEHFLGKKVIVLPDTNEVGKRYEDAVCASLKLAGIEHKVCDFAAYGNDVRDFLKEHSAAELVEYLGSDWFYKESHEIQRAA